MTTPPRLHVLGAVIAACALVPTGPSQGLSGADLFSAPLHRASEAIAGGGDVLLAAGRDYKAAFDDGFTFYPYRGPDRVHLPLRWRTEEVTVGGRRLGRAAAPTLRAGDHRLAWDHGAWSEAYEVRAEGIEQSFVFPAPLPGGDLEVVGRIATPLRAAPAAAAQQALVFRDPDGRPLVRYGEALAFDARGRRAAVTTAWDGEVVRLRLPAAFLAGAAYPVTLDPLTSREPVESGASQVCDLDLVRDSAGGTGSMMVVYSRQFAANDLDAFARTADPDFNASNLVFTDISPSRSTKGGQCAYVADARRWVAVFEQELFSPTVSDIVAYLHDRGDTTTNSGTLVRLSHPAGTTARNPDVGGRLAGGGNNAFVVYQRDTTTTQENTIYTEVFGALVDARTGAEVATTDLSWFPSGTTYDREEPTVVQTADGSFTFWVVAWHEWYRPVAPADDWDINLTRITFTGQKIPQIYRLGVSTHPYHKRYPQIAGRAGRFMLTYTFGPTMYSETGEELHTQRFDWPDSVREPVIGPPRVLIADPTKPDLALPKIAYDDRTRSHWGITYRRGLSWPGDLFAARVGYRGGVVETQTLFSSPSAAGTGTAVAFAPEGAGSFPVLFATTEPGFPLAGRQLTYPASAVNAAYGTGCGGQIAASPPYAGSEFFTVALTGAQPSVPAGFGIAAGSAQTSLAGAGMAGCFLNVGVPAVWLPATTDPTGAASVTLALPDGPGSSFNLFFQWVHVAPGANAFGVLTTEGLQAQVR